MAGTRAGALKAWENRRKTYGKSGRAVKQVDRSIDENRSKRGRSSMPDVPEYITIDDQEVHVSWYSRSRLDALERETSRMNGDLMKMYRAKPDTKLPRYVLQIQNDARKKLQRWVRQRQTAIKVISRHVQAVENKKFGNRYNR